MQISNVKQREFWQERNEPAKVKGFPYGIRMPKMSKAEHRKRIMRQLNNNPRFKEQEI